VAYILDASANCGLTFSILLGLLFVYGMYVVADRLFFFSRHWWQLRRPGKGLLAGSLAGPKAAGSGDESKSVFQVFEEKAREFRLTSEELVYTSAITDHATEAAVNETLDGEKLDLGQSRLQLLGVTAPTVGFVGTLVGLIQSFRDLGTGGEINEVISGLGLSMTTSLVGAVISVVFLTVAWILGNAQLQFERHLDQIITNQQTGYQSVI
jgi:biopolymer transport protein ExbB/TolQ